MMMEINSQTKQINTIFKLKQFEFHSERASVVGDSKMQKG
jgi:hypothetical protein